MNGAYTKLNTGEGRTIKVAMTGCQLLWFQQGLVTE